MDDLLIRGSTGASRIEIAVFTSTQLVRDAAKAHDLRGTGAIALGRLLTATALVGLTSRRAGVTSIQILSKSRIQQVFADVTEHGWLRGYVKNRALTYPLLLNEDPEARRTIGPTVAPGQVSVVRMGEHGEYIQSSTPIRDGEIDSDVDHFLNQSDQVPSVLRCETLLNRAGDIVVAGGILLRAMPDTELSDIYALRDQLRDGFLAQALQADHSTPKIMEELSPGAQETDPRIVPIWRCRCSRKKVLVTVQMLDVMEIASMVAEDKSVDVRCELCNTTHVISPTELQEIMAGKISAKS